MTRKWIKDIYGNELNKYYLGLGKNNNTLLPSDGYTFVSCCGGHLYQKSKKKDETYFVSGIAVANRRVIGHLHKDVDKTIVNTSNGPITIFAVKEKNGIGYNV